MNLKELLKNKLTEEEMEYCPRSYEVIGDIAILEVPEELENKEKTIAETLLENRKNIRLVVKKGSEREGDFRIKNYIKLVGEGSLETVHREYGCSYHLDISKVYFSSKESTEREKIVELVKDKKRVLVLGAGIGPYPIAIAKHSNVNVVGVEMNPEAVDYFEKNIIINKVQDRVQAVLMDAREYANHHQNEFELVLIAMPDRAEQFIDIGKECLKENGTLVYYTIMREEEMSNERKILAYSPGVWKVAITTTK